MLRRQYGTKLLPILVPPWDRIDPNILVDLPKLGFEAISGFGTPQHSPNLIVINTQIDVIDWNRNNRCRDEAALVKKLIREIKKCFSSAKDQKVGIVTHHLYHDEAAWEFLEKLLSETRRHSAVRWMIPFGE